MDVDQVIAVNKRGEETESGKYGLRYFFGALVERSDWLLKRGRYLGLASEIGTHPGFETTCTSMSLDILLPTL